MHSSGPPLSEATQKAPARSGLPILFPVNTPGPKRMRARPLILPENRMARTNEYLMRTLQGGSHPPLMVPLMPPLMHPLMHEPH